MSVSDFLSIRTIRSGSIAPTTGWIGCSYPLHRCHHSIFLALFLSLVLGSLCSQQSHSQCQSAHGKIQQWKKLWAPALIAALFRAMQRGAKCKHKLACWRQAHLHPSVSLLGDFWHFSVFVEPAQNLNPFAVIKQFRLLALASRKDCLILFTWLWFSHPWKISPSRSPAVDADTPLKWNIRLNY